jgi:mannose-6-phosphate isomerase class I
MSDLTARLEPWVEQSGGVLRLRPTYVRRFYQDGGRLGLAEAAGGTYQEASGLWIPERWIASTVAAANLHPIAGEGLSFLDLPGDGFRAGGGRVTLKEALEVMGPRLLGEHIHTACGSEFRVLSKILDPFEPIVFHIHARDSDVQRHPEYFPGHRFGKDEAYYFLDRPKGMVHYTHAGLTPGVTREELIRAVRKGRDFALELSPVINQRFGEGFFVPSGVPHRPGTALTLEIQQPSDVYTLLEDTAGGKMMAPDQIHPGFPDLDTAYQFIDMETAQDPDILERYRLVPTPTGRGAGEGEEHWIFPPTVSPKFSGTRVRVPAGGSFECQEAAPYAVLVWSGTARITGAGPSSQELHPGDEALVTHSTAALPHRYQASGGEPLELFKFFPAQV